MLTKIGLLFSVFMAGAVAALNLSYIKYGVPLHYNGGWGNFTFACFLALVFGAVVATKRT